MKQERRYVGITNDINGGMTDTAKIIRDAWVFGIIPESETCEGWQAAGIEALWEKVSAQWKKYNYQVGLLPEDLKLRFMRIQDEAIARAKASGWDGEMELAGD